VGYIDVARSYGRAEEFVGTWLRARGLAPGMVVVGSKWGYTYTADWHVEAAVHEVKEHSITVLQRQWQESQARLGAHLKLYQVHSATLESGVLQNAAVLAGLVRLKAEGIAIGLTVSGPGQREVIALATTLVREGVRVFDCVQATWNLLEPSAGPALRHAHAAGLGVIVKEALANGRLTTRNPETEIARALAREAARLGTTLEGVALAAALAQPWADVILSGATRTDHLAGNLQALEVPWDGDAAARVAGLAEPSDAYWARRSTLAWN
jgi:aryl-alcohol dehydrogenase-like predicted oxidoreductase